MRRPWVLVVGLVAVFLLGLGLTFAIWLSKEVALGVGRAGDDAKSYRLTGARVDGELQPDGALEVREAIRFQFSGSFSGAYRDIPLEDGQAVTNVVVSEGSTAYRAGGNTDLGGFGLPGTYGTEQVTKDGRRYVRVVWHYAASDETRIFAIDYRFTGLVKAYDDAVDLYWKVWGDEWQGSLDALAATLTLPHPVDVSRERVYAHPGHVEGVVVAGAEQIRLGARDVPREQYVELRALLPRDVLDANPTSAQVVHEPAWDRIQDEERKDYADAQRDADRVAAVVDHPALAGFGTVAGGVLLGLLVWPLAYRRYGREPDVPGTAIEYLPDPPDDAPPAVAQALTTQADSGGGGDRMAATFLDLIVRGRFVARVGDTEDGPDLLLEQGDRSVHVESWEKPLIEIVESVLPADGSVAIPLGDMSKQLKELSTSKRETNASRKSSFHDKLDARIDEEERQFVLPTARWIVRALGGLVCVVGGILGIVGLAAFAADVTFTPLLLALIAFALSVAGLTVLLSPRAIWVSTRPEAKARIVRWEAYRRYLEDLPRFADEVPTALPLWERMLVYATAFGCADRVAAAARLRIPELAQAGVGSGSAAWWVGAPIGHSLMAGTAGAGLATAHDSMFADFSGQLSASTSSPSSGGSGGGGSFGGGGGGGGGAW